MWFMLQIFFVNYHDGLRTAKKTVTREDLTHQGLLKHYIDLEVGIFSIHYILKYVLTIQNACKWTEK